MHSIVRKKLILNQDFFKNSLGARGAMDFSNCGEKFQAIEFLRIKRGRL